MFDHIISLIFFAAATQGFLLAGVLAIHKHNVQANHILAFWVALLSLDLLGQVYYLENLFREFPAFIGVTNFLPLCYGGFLFLYVRGITQAKSICARDSLHFIGFFVGLALNLPTLLQDTEAKLHFVDSIIDSRAPWYFQIVDWLIPIYATVYAILSGVLLSRYRESANNNMPRLRWLQTLLIINMVIWVVVWACTLAPFFEIDIAYQWIYLLVSLFIYVLGYTSLRQPDIFAASVAPVAAKDATPKYGDNRLPDDLREQILLTIEQYMREQAPWRSNNLTLAQLAEGTGLSSHHISQVLNDHHGQSFNDYLNQYRVNALCAMLSEPQNQNLLDLAMSCGFSSKSSFNAIFKKQTGKTPSEYRKSVQA